MEYGISRNGAGYYDPTPFQAIKNIMDMEKSDMEFYEGDIVEIEMKNGGTKEAVILSVHNRYSTILLLTDNSDLPYRVNCRGVKYTDPGMLGYAFNENVASLIRSMKKDELDDILREVVEALGYSTPVKEIVKEVPVEVPVEVRTESEPEAEVAAKMVIELAKASAERDVYKNLYETLIGSMIAK